jgi:hypothetical protein
VSTAAAQPGWVNAGRVWGILVLGALFGVGGYFLLRRSFADWPTAAEASPTLVYVLYVLVGLAGLVKGEIIFRRKVMARSLARARQAIGETGWVGDAVLAPFCMLSLYRPWKIAHALSSWLLIPLMVGLAVFFRNLERMGVADGTAALIRGPIYFGIGLALIYGCLVYLIALFRFLAWWQGNGQPETNPLPAPAGQPMPNGQAARSIPATGREPITEGR